MTVEFFVHGYNPFDNPFLSSSYEWWNPKKQENTDIKFTIPISSFMKNNFTEYSMPELEKVLRDAYDFAKQELNFCEDHRKLKIISKYIDDQTNCMYDGSYCKGRVRNYPSKYLMELEIIEDCDIFSTLRTFFHECVHVKQFYKREIFFDSDNNNDQMIIWKNYPIGTINGIPYDQRPWEQEAKILQDQLLQKYVNCCKIEIAEILQKRMNEIVKKDLQ